MSNQTQILNVFEQIGYKPQSLLSRDIFNRILDQLNGRPYQQDVSNQLWEQLPISQHNEVYVRDIARIVVQGQKLLIEKINDVNKQIQEVQQWIERMRSQHGQQDRIQQLLIELNECKQNRNIYQEDLQLLTKPFNIQINPRQTFSYQININNLEDELIRSVYTTERESPSLKLVFYLILILIFNQICINLAKPDFLNIMLCTLLSCIFPFNIFGKTYVTLIIWALIITSGLDLMWISIWTPSYWSSNINQISNTWYTKYIIFATIINTLLKIVITIILFDFKDVKQRSIYVIYPFDNLKLSVLAKQPSWKNKLDSINII